MAGHVTNSDSWIAEHLPEPQEKFAAFAEKVYEDGALDRKTKELIAAATASVGRCSPCTDGHLEGAQEAGASEAEVAEALAVAWGQGGGTQVFWMKNDFADLLGESWRQDFIPEADRAFWDFKNEVFEGDALARKTKELIAAAVSSMLRCRHCTRAHIEAALDAGAEKAEVAEALAVLWVIGSGTQVVWNKEGFEEHLRSPSHAHENGAPAPA
jgi:AhpD family alkylhydroperoxidase